MAFRQPVFQFSIRYGMYANPSGRMEAIAQALRELVSQEGLESYFGSLGGGVHTYGTIWREAAPLGIHDRNKLEHWLREQPMMATVRLGQLEELDESGILNAPYDCEFTVDNLTDADRKIAGDKEREMKQRIEIFQQHRRPTKNSDEGPPT